MVKTGPWWGQHRGGRARVEVPRLGFREASRTACQTTSALLGVVSPFNLQNAEAFAEVCWMRRGGGWRAEDDGRETVTLSGMEDTSRRTSNLCPGNLPPTRTQIIPLGWTILETFHHLPPIPSLDAECQAGELTFWSANKQGQLEPDLHLTSTDTLPCRPCPRSTILPCSLLFVLQLFCPFNHFFQSKSQVVKNTLLTTATSESFQEACVVAFTDYSNYTSNNRLSAGQRNSPICLSSDVILDFISSCCFFCVVCRLKHEDAINRKRTNALWFCLIAGRKTASFA
ncbi:uncharacterized protein LOC133659706 isoform X2 [Entelurus aequoreus]|uniref:uncharacterized protein LOC133659706 isoform X2 n=1 Tax=Entelurus aequoreus TaxID=161455 RepID=UPI002B1D743E|nr:uncharacterized protein LOC133659706 isoform X2 [Entelurus aequoreus]